MGLLLRFGDFFRPENILQLRGWAVDFFAIKGSVFVLHTTPRHGLNPDSVSRVKRTSRRRNVVFHSMQKHKRLGRRTSFDLRKVNANDQILVGNGTRLGRTSDILDRADEPIS